MLNLDAFAATKRFDYDIPAPFGPKGGPAKLWVEATLAGSPEFQAALDEATHQARLLDKVREDECKDDPDALLRRRVEDASTVAAAIQASLYDHCNIKWGTTIQSGGKNVEATRDNYLELATYKHEAIASVFSQIAKDVANTAKFVVLAAEDEAKN